MIADYDNDVSGSISVFLTWLEVGKEVFLLCCFPFSSRCLLLLSCPMNYFVYFVILKVCCLSCKFILFFKQICNLIHQISLTIYNFITSTQLNCYGLSRKRASSGLEAAVIMRYIVSGVTCFLCEGNNPFQFIHQL